MVRSSCHSMWALGTKHLLLLMDMYHARASTEGAKLGHTTFQRLFHILLCDLATCLFALAGLWLETAARKCGACRVLGHRVTHCCSTWRETCAAGALIPCAGHAPRLPLASTEGAKLVHIPCRELLHTCCVIWLPVYSHLLVYGSKQLPKSAVLAAY